MSCNCGNKTATGKPVKTKWTLTLSNGSTKTYTTELEANAAKARNAGSKLS